MHGCVMEPECRCGLMLWAVLTAELERLSHKVQLELTATHAAWWHLQLGRMGQLRSGWGSGHSAACCSLSWEGRAAINVWLFFFSPLHVHSFAAFCSPFLLLSYFLPVDYTLGLKGPLFLESILNSENSLMVWIWGLLERKKKCTGLLGSEIEVLATEESQITLISCLWSSLCVTPCDALWNSAFL